MVSKLSARRVVDAGPITGEHDLDESKLRQVLY